MITKIAVMIKPIFNLKFEFFQNFFTISTSFLRCPLVYETMHIYMFVDEHMRPPWRTTNPVKSVCNGRS